MAKVPRIRHVGYTVGGIPIVRRMVDVNCLPPPEFLSHRHVGYTAAGIPIVAYAWNCCDIEPATYVEADCWPFGEGPGISDKLTLYLLDSQNCASGRDKKIILEYAAGVWFGQMEIRDKVIDFEFTCNMVDAEDPAKFTLTWDCLSFNNFQTAGYTCLDPLRVDFAPNLDFGDCCDCSDTDVPTLVNFVVTGNCHKLIRMVRHVGYTSAGVPIVAKAKDCPFDATYEEDCNSMRCGIVAELDATGDCECMVTNNPNPIPLTYQDGSGWIYTAGAAECGIVSMGVECEDLPNGQVRLTVSIACDEYNRGTGFIEINFEDLVDLDELVAVTMTWDGSPPDPDPDPHCCTGTITVRLLRP